MQEIVEVNFQSTPTTVIPNDLLDAAWEMVGTNSIDTIAVVDTRVTTNRDRRIAGDFSPS